LKQKRLGRAIPSSLLYQTIEVLANVPFTFRSAGREPSGTLVSKWRAGGGIPLYWADCSSIDGYTVLALAVPPESTLGKDLTVPSAHRKGHCKFVQPE